MALTPFTSRLLVDAGISFGDEGKGRLIPEVVDELRQSGAGEAPVGIVLKVNGGANSGHTAGGVKLNLLPAGVVEKSVPVLAVGAGVVADPRKFHWEARPLEKKDYAIYGRLLIDERTIVSDLTHRLLDLATECYRGRILSEEIRGTTGRGITPAYLDEVGQWQTCFADFLGPREIFERRLRQKADRAIRMIRHVYQVDESEWNGLFDTLTEAETRANAEGASQGLFENDEFDFTRFRGPEPFTLNVELLAEVYWRAGSALASCIGDVRETVLGCLRDGRHVIAEFGQAYWLDKRHGFPPNVTASHTFTPELFLSAGIPLQPVHGFGVAKAYDTKVGTHLFLTAIPDDHPLGVRLRRIEFGTSTGRQRMVGWYDAVEKGDALRYGGFHDLVINKLDALTHDGDWNGELRICTAYRDSSGRVYRHVPRNDAVRRTLTPVYESHPGWSEDIGGVRNFADLPVNARRYVAAMVRALLDVAYDGGPRPENPLNLRYLGVGPLPSQIIKDVPPTRELLAER